MYVYDMTYSGLLAIIFTEIEPTLVVLLACVSFLRSRTDRPDSY